MSHGINSIQSQNTPWQPRSENVKCCLAVCLSVILALGVVLGGLALGGVISFNYIYAAVTFILLDVVLASISLALHRHGRNNPPVENRPASLTIQAGSPPVDSDFGNLPKVLYHEILKHLPDRDVKTLGEVCRYFHHRAHDELHRGWTESQQLALVHGGSHHSDDHNFPKNLIACSKDSLVILDPVNGAKFWQMDREGKLNLKQQSPYDISVDKCLGISEDLAYFSNSFNSIIVWDVVQNRLQNPWEIPGISEKDSRLIICQDLIITTLEARRIFGVKARCSIWQASDHTWMDDIQCEEGIFEHMFALVNNRWLVGRGRYIDLVAKYQCNASLLAKAQGLCAYQDRLIYMECTDNLQEYAAVYEVNMPELTNPQLLITGIEYSHMQVHGEVLYLQSKDGIVLRYHFEKQIWLSKLRLGKWSMQGVVGDYLIAQEKRCGFKKTHENSGVWTKKVRAFKLNFT